MSINHYGNVGTPRLGNRVLSDESCKDELRQTADRARRDTVAVRTDAIVTPVRSPVIGSGVKACHAFWRPMRFGSWRKCALLVLALILPAGCCVTARPADARPVGIHRSERVASDGTSLFLETHGTDRRAPVLLWLHGGPGGPERPLFRYFNSQLEDHFVVSYWDQRGAGRSYDPDADPHKLTVDQHLADLDVVVDHLRRSFSRDQIALIGHSWGGALGMLYVKAHPEKVSAFVAVAPLVSMIGAQQAQYDFVVDEASRRHDRGTLARLQRIGRPPHRTAEDLMAMETLAGRYGAVFHKNPHKQWVIFRGMLRGLARPWEVPRFIHGIHVSLKAMHEELNDLDLTRSVLEVQVPVFFLLGRYDHHVDSTIGARYLAELRAPAKQVIWFENSAHNAPFEEPQLFNETVVRLFELQKTDHGTASNVPRHSHRGPPDPVGPRHSR